MINESSAHTYRSIFPAVIAAIVFLAFVGIADAQNQKFQFGVIGDTSYSKVAEQEFERLMAVLNKEGLAFRRPRWRFRGRSDALSTEPG